MMFWIYMLVCSLLIPLIILGVGALLAKHPPKQINWAYGYRTRRSTKNKETWLFAQVYAGRLWMRLSWPMLAAALVVMGCLYGKPIDTVSLGAGILVGAQTLVLVLTILPVERALKRNFDELGRPRKG
ncbi:MAG: SdpI family protein [Oscillospiraceae bacterium]|jgi:uncharacterized membrane protein